jgi:hypothetical protein
MALQAEQQVLRLEAVTEPTWIQTDVTVSV